MPSKAVPRRIGDFIFYYYAKLVIAPSAGQANNYRFIIDRYRRLTRGEMSMSEYEREIQKLAQQPGECVFCGSHSAVTTVELVPRRAGGPVGLQNIVYSCDKCASSKGEKGLIQWWCDDLGHEPQELPRVPAGLFLKIAYERHATSFTLKQPCNHIRDLWPDR